MQSDIDAVRTALARRSGRARTNYPPELRRQIIETTRSLRDGGWSWHSITEALGLSEKALRHLMKRWENSNQQDSMRPVTIAARPVPTTRLTLTSPNGWRIEGLDVDTAAALLAKLPC